MSNLKGYDTISHIVKILGGPKVVGVAAVTIPPLCVAGGYFINELIHKLKESGQIIEEIDPPKEYIVSSETEVCAYKGNDGCLHIGDKIRTLLYFKNSDAFIIDVVGVPDCLYVLSREKLMEIT